MVDNIIILSEKSSGSSVLQRELSRHSKISTIQITKHTEAETLYWVKAANILGYPKHSFWGGKPPFPKRYSRKSINYLLASNTNIDLSRYANCSDWEFIKSGWDNLIESQAPVYLEKSPHHLNQWPALACLNKYIKESGKNIKIIGLVRNPLSVIYSAYQRWSSDVYNRQFFWEQSYRNLLAMRQIHGNDSIKIIRYEDLIGNPTDNFKDLFDFLGLDYESQIGSELHSNSLNKWESDPEFSFRLNETVMEIGNEFGYSAEDMTCIKPNSNIRNFDKRVLQHVQLFLKAKYNFYRLHVFNRD